MIKKNTMIEYSGLILLVIISIIGTIIISTSKYQAKMPIPMPQELVGEYSYDGVNWQPLTLETELPVYQGDLYLRGHFLRAINNNSALCFYRNHIGVSIAIDGYYIYRDNIIHRVIEDKRFLSSMCAREWVECPISETNTEALIEIQLHNPHKVGNSNAYREFLTTICVQPFTMDLLKASITSYGSNLREIAGLLVICALLLLGAACVSGFVKIPVVGELLKLGLMALFAGGFIAFDTVDVSLWNGLNAMNTYASQLCMMLFSLVLGMYSSDIFQGKTKIAAKCVVFASTVIDITLLLLSVLGVILIYDTLPIWIGFQLIISALFIIFCIWELFHESKYLLIIMSTLVMNWAILADFYGIGSTIVWRSPCSKIVFVCILFVYFLDAAKNIILNYRASVRATKLEKELEDSRIAIMLSQIKPHFLYNVLNSIYHLYNRKPELAQDAVSSFADYLRCNMLSIEKSGPIPFSEEYQHIQTYLSLEQIRFSEDLHVVYDVEVTNFCLPPLTVEPLVENAVKHGVTKKRGGGVVTISTRETEDNYVVIVEDTGKGFDPNNYRQDGKPHVGIQNVKKRLHDMVGGTLSITSSSEGTVAVVTIPLKNGKLN